MESGRCRRLRTEAYTNAYLESLFQPSTQFFRYEGAIQLGQAPVGIFVAGGKSVFREIGRHCIKVLAPGEKERARRESAGHSVLRWIRRDHGCLGRKGLSVWSVQEPAGASSGGKGIRRALGVPPCAQQGWVFIPGSSILMGAYRGQGGQYLTGTLPIDKVNKEASGRGCVDTASNGTLGVLAER